MYNYPLKKNFRLLSTFSIMIRIESGVFCFYDLLIILFINSCIQEMDDEVKVITEG